MILFRLLRNWRRGDLALQFCGKSTSSPIQRSTQQGIKEVKRKQVKNGDFDIRVKSFDEITRSQLNLKVIWRSSAPVLNQHDIAQSDIGPADGIALLVSGDRERSEADGRLIDDPSQRRYPACPEIESLDG